MKVSDYAPAAIGNVALQEWMDNVTAILNNSKYQVKVLSSVPDWTGYEGEFLFYSSGTDRAVYLYNNGQWNKIGFTNTTGQALIDLGSSDSVIQGNDTDGFWVGNAVFASAPFRVDLSGNLVATSATITGAINATSGAFLGNLTIGNGTTSSGTITMNIADGQGDCYIAAGKTDFTNTQTGFILGQDDSDSNLPKFYIGTSSAYFNFTGAGISLAGASISSATLTALAAGSEIAIQGWQSDIVFSATDLNTVAWASGTIRLLDGTTYSITGSNTGNMSALTYIYLSIATSTTALQTTTTAANAVGTGKILIAVAQNVAAGNAIFQVFGGAALGGLGKLVTADDIVANTITANQIAANTITGTEIYGSALSAIFADLGTITAGNFTLDSSGYIRGGQTAYDTGTGFWLGYSSGYKFSLGNSSGNKILWDGSALSVTGTINATAGYFGDGSTRVAIESAGLNVGTTGSIRGGQTAYATGTGFWIGYTGGVYKFSIGSSTNYMTWDGTDLTIVGNVQGIGSYLDITNDWGVTGITSGATVADGAYHTIYNSASNRGYCFIKRPGQNTITCKCQVYAGVDGLGADIRLSVAKKSDSGVYDGGGSSQTVNGTVIDQSVYDDWEWITVSCDISACTDYILYYAYLESEINSSNHGYTPQYRFAKFYTSG